ncbi:MAG: hypothetical protein Q7J16_12070, partial [Candidatus Cloacimonadales bacterium]|nr:hypothetical protein [Candidatus Cloacimonadales bacterium]
MKLIAPPQPSPKERENSGFSQLKVSFPSPLEKVVPNAFGTKSVYPVKFSLLNISLGMRRMRPISKVIRC